MFQNKECLVCKEKDKWVVYLQAQVKELQDRLLSLEPRALAAFKTMEDPKAKEGMLGPMRFYDEKTKEWKMLSEEETKEWGQETNQILSDYVGETHLSEENS